jgi:hypothetical protein
VVRRPAKAVLGALLGWLARLWPRRVGVALLYHGIADSDRLALPRISPPTGNIAEFSYVLARTLWESR